MACETLLETFLKVSGIVGWAGVFLILLFILRQKEQIKKVMATKKMHDNIKKVMEPGK